MELQLLNSIYNLYLMLIGGYIILAIGIVGYMFGLYRLYKHQKVFAEEVQQKIIDQWEIKNNTSKAIEE